jgi:hypothetical protein
MAGFKTVRAWGNAADVGNGWYTSFRKSPSQATTAGNWCDLSMASGNPVPNYYAASPLISSVLNGDRGIYHGANVEADPDLLAAPASKWLHRLGIGTPTANAIPSHWYLLDYLLFYPFIDMDSGEEQGLTNSVLLPRYADGVGVSMFMVNVAPTVGGGQFTVNYTNQNGTSGRVTPVQFCSAATNIATLTATNTNASGFSPFIRLQAGDSGVRSVQSVTFTVANGGLGALVLCHPLMTAYLSEVNVFAEFEAIREKPGPAQIYDGAYLNLIGMTPTGSIASGVIAGELQSVWG